MIVSILMISCNVSGDGKETHPIAGVQKDTPEYFLLRPEAEKAYGYSHSVKIGQEIKISGAVSMDEKGNPKHYGCTFDYVEKSWHYLNS